MSAFIYGMFTHELVKRKQVGQDLVYLHKWAQLDKDGVINKVRDFADHLRMEHGIVRPVNCASYSQSFGSLPQLTEHSTVVHPRKVERQNFLWRCQFGKCQYSNFDLSNLVSHNYRFAHR
jgi:hypothetical protein